VHLSLVPQLLAMAELLSHLPVAVLPLGLGMVQGLQASWDLPAMDSGVLVMIAAVVMLR
jgi:hypothetical protein